jgi:DNA repair protein RecN (Recombination protein N)
MLRELEVRDLGIIDAVRVELPRGFVALTGETGAGKSLLVQSLQLLAGERADSEQVRSGCERLLVEACFDVPGDEQARAALAELGVAEGGELVLRREVTSGGRSRAWVNDVPVTVGALQRLGPYLLAIHGQHEQRGLADPTTHLGLVDTAGQLLGVRAGVAQAYDAWADVAQRLAEQRRALAGRRDRLDVIAFQLREIAEAGPTAGEEERLREERALLRHGERIGQLLTTAREELSGEGGAVALARAGRAVRELASLGLSVADTADALSQAQLLAEDAERELASLAERVRVDPERLEAVETRLVLLERIARKYGGSCEAVLGHAAALEEERARLEDAENDIARLEGAEAEALEDYLSVATHLSRQRAEAARLFVGEVVAVLDRLGMQRTRLELRLGVREDTSGRAVVRGIPVMPARDGIDTGELVISPNPGEELRPLVRIASGGELSRIHLAIRTVLRERGGRDPLTLLFDEVDAGIGGRVADELGRLLADLGRRDQVLVVTHLPQVAAMADAHFVVSKAAHKGRTVTRVRSVEGEGRVAEVVRMLGGGPATPAASQHARELLGGRAVAADRRG